MVLGAGVIFLSVLLYFTADIQFQRACIKVIRRLLKTVALRQARPSSCAGTTVMDPRSSCAATDAVKRVADLRVCADRRCATGSSRNVCLPGQ